ncbi:hypothetical protein [Xanthomonas tesorieronis]|uniref:hypothetical protein n=1 Tax=Xanthomonas tesorieronis TaxID=3160839 RepID=UPI003511014A
MATLILFLTGLSWLVLSFNTVAWGATILAVRRRPWMADYLRLNWLDAAAALAVCWLLAGWLS